MASEQKGQANERVQISAQHFDVSAPIVEDFSVDSYSLRRFTSIENIKNTTSTRFEVEVPSSRGKSYALPSHGYLELKLQLTANDSDPYTYFNGSQRDGTVEIALENGAWSIFNQATLTMNGQVIEDDQNSHISNTVKALVNFSNDYADSVGLGMGWAKDTSEYAESRKYKWTNPADGMNATRAHTATRQINDDNDLYNIGFTKRKSQLVASGGANALQATYMIPLRHLFGSAELDRVYRGVEFRFSFTRRSHAEMLFKSANAINAGLGDTPDGFVKINEINVWMPFLNPSIALMPSLERIYASNQKLVYPIRQWKTYVSEASIAQGERVFRQTTRAKPIMVFVACQSNRFNDMTKNSLVFDNCDVQNVYLTANGVRMPELNYTPRYSTAGSEDWTRPWAEFQRVSNVFNQDSGNQVDLASYKTLYPIYAFDLSQMSGILGASAIELEAVLDVQTPGGGAGTKIVMTIVSEKEIILDTVSDLAMVESKESLITPFHMK